MQFLCDYLNEIVILSDGSITTCCMDPIGLNRYADIGQDDFETVLKKHKCVLESIVEDPLSMPRCRICFEKISAAGFPETGTYKTDPSNKEIIAFINKKKRPRQLVIEMSSICNLTCNGCMQSRADIPSTRKHPLIDFDALSTWILDTAENIQYLRLYNYGETFVHPRSFEFIEFIRKLAPDIKIEIATNGLLLDTREKRKRLIDANVHCIYFSIHGSDAQSVEKYMTSVFDFEKMMGIISDCSRLKIAYGKNTCLIWKYLLFEWNDTDDHIEQAKYLARKNGIDQLIFWLPGFPSPSKRFPEHSMNSVVDTIIFNH